jgi:hypothetical protein
VKCNYKGIQTENITKKITMRIARNLQTNKVRDIMVKEGDKFLNSLGSEINLKRNMTNR